MIFIQKDDKYFNIPELIFNYEPLFLSVSRIGSIINGNRVSPNGAISLEYDKVLAMKKAFSEMIERRNLILGSTNGKSGIESVWDLIQNKETEIPRELTSYSINKPYIIDTTGGAAHISSKLAIKNALVELLEKNALFLFWYGKQGYRIRKSKEIKELLIYKKLSLYGYEVKLYLNDFFSPVKVVFSIVYKDNEFVSCGIGTHFNLIKSVENSIKEAYLLAWQNEEHQFIIKQNSSLKNTNNFYVISPDTSQLDYIENLIDLPLYSEDDVQEEIPFEVKPILSILPKWIESIYVIYYKNYIFNKLKYVKVFSYDLFNHVPHSEFINLNLNMNKKTIDLKEAHLKFIPNSIFI